MNDQLRGARPGARGRAAMLAAVSAVSAGVLASPAIAAGTPAGTSIQNVATATYDTPTGEATVDSNVVELKVDELLDVTVSWGDPADVGTAPGLLGQVLRFTVANGGNGTESFALATVGTGGGDDFDPAVTSIILDSNGNNAFDAGIDTVYVAGANDPELDPDESMSVFVLSTIPLATQDGNRGRARLTAAARTGTGTPGTSFAGLGQGGGNAVVGATGADAEQDGWYKVAKAAIAFVKTAAVADPFGGSNRVPGATITYSLAATVSGSGSLANVRVADAIPAGTSFTPGSITLEGSALTDAEDGDSGKFTGSGISVGLGTLAAGASRTVTFKVKID